MYVRDDGNLGFPVVAAVQAAAAAASLFKKQKKPKLSVANFPPQPAYATQAQLAAWFQDFTAAYNDGLARTRAYKSAKSRAGSLKDYRAVAAQLGVQTAENGDIIGFSALAQTAPPAPPATSGVIVAPPPPPTTPYQPETNAQPAVQFPPYPYPPPPPPPPPAPDVSIWAMPIAVVVAAWLSSRRRGD